MTNALEVEVDSCFGPSLKNQPPTQVEISKQVDRIDLDGAQRLLDRLYLAKTLYDLIILCFLS